MLKSRRSRTCFSARSFCVPLNFFKIYTEVFTFQRTKTPQGLPWKYTPEHTCRIFGKLALSKDAKYSWSGKAMAPAIAVSVLLSEMKAGGKWQAQQENKKKKEMLSHLKTTRVNKEVKGVICTSCAHCGKGSEIWLRSWLTDNVTVVAA